MSTVADDLLNDFGSSGDEAEDIETNGDAAPESMDVDGDAPAEDDEANDLDDAEAAKAKVEKMQLAGVKDVRSVASLMETLEPVLEVSSVCFPFPVRRRILTFCRKFNITERKRQHRQQILETLRIIQNTICSLSPTVFQRK
jgi:U4/U6 small nuclear ribonucleoprotein PRP31